MTSNEVNCTELMSNYYFLPYYWMATEYTHVCTYICITNVELSCQLIIKFVVRY